MPSSGIRVGSVVRIATPDGRDIEATVMWAKRDLFGVKFQVEQSASSPAETVL
jgi:hypothetical protein